MRIGHKASWHFGAGAGALLAALLVVLAVGVSPAIATSTNDKPPEPPLLSPAGLTNAVKKIFTIATQGSLPVDYEARAASDLKDGVVRLTDDNVWDVIRNSEEDELWVVIIHGPPTEAVTPLYLEAHTNASALARDALTNDEYAALEGQTDLNKVHWARMDFVNEWKTCARWLTMRPPWVLFVTKSGKELRFVHPRSLPAKGEILFNAVRDGEWKNAQIWNSQYQPGAERDWIPELYVKIVEQASKLTKNIPHWALVLFSGAVGQAVLKWLHSSPTPAAPTSRAGTSADGAGEKEPTVRVATTSTPGVQVETVLTARVDEKPKKGRGRTKKTA